MDRYREILAMAVWAATVCWFAGAAAREKDTRELTQAREEYCVADMGRKLADIEARVEPFLRAWQTTLGPALARQVQ